MWYAIRPGLLFLAALFLLGTLFAAPLAHAADKLDGIYTGSGGPTPELYRIVFVDFAADGTALLQQNWQNRQPEVWHARWTQDRKQIHLTFDPVKDKPAIKPLLFEFKRGTLTPIDWDASILGVLGPPKLTTLGGNNPKPATVSGCALLNTHDPTQNCITWDSRN